MSALDRRALLNGAVATLGALGLGACDRLTTDPAVADILGRTEGLTRRAQRLIQPRGALAREFPASAISRDFRANGSLRPASTTYAAHEANGFADWRIEVGGLVERPLSISLTELRARPGRAQITRHDCVEGWSSIGKWTGARLGPILAEAGLKPEARYIVFYCADQLDPAPDGSGFYYESIDLIDAFHPQTILAYAMNDQPLPVAHGAPVRLRVERQLGYKHAKYVTRIEAVADFRHIAGGKGGFWEDRGYEWYAGV